MSNKEKFLKLVSAEDTKTMAGVKDRIKNRDMLWESQQIALKVLVRLSDLGWSQKNLAKQLNVSPQQITKIVSGKENMTIDTLIKLQNILNIPVLASFYESKANAIEKSSAPGAPGNEITGSSDTVKKQAKKILVLNEPPKPNYKVSKSKTVRKKV